MPGRAGPGRRDGLLAELAGCWPQAHPEDAAVREQLAGGLFVTLNSEHGLAHEDALLADLRALAGAYPRTKWCANSWPWGIEHWPICRSTRQDLGASGRAAAGTASAGRSAPARPGGARRLAVGLCNTLRSAKNEQHPARRDALLADLRGSGRRGPRGYRCARAAGRGPVRHARRYRGRAGPARRDGLLAELRALAEAHPEDPAVRERLAWACSTR